MTIWTIPERASCNLAGFDFELAIIEQRVHARGERYEEYPVGTKPVVAARVIAPILDSDLESEEEEEYEDGDDEPALKAISAREVEQLQLDCTRNWLRLRPQNWALMGGTGWREVQISRNELAQAFVTNSNAAADDSLEPRNEEPHPIVAAYHYLFPNGLPAKYPKEKRRNVEINERTLKINKTTYSKSTIREVLKAAGIEN